MAKARQKRLRGLKNGGYGDENSGRRRDGGKGF